MIGFEGAGRYPRLIQALTGDDEIVPPGITLESDRPEYSVLKNEVPWYTLVSLTPTGGRYAIVGVTPRQTDALCVVTQVIVFNANGSNQPFKIGIQAGQATSATGLVAARDSRRGAATTSYIKNDQVAAPLTGFDSWNVFTGGPPLIFTQPWILTSGSTLIVAAANVSQIVEAMFFGYERTLRPEELAQ